MYTLIKLKVMFECRRLVIVCVAIQIGDSMCGYL